MYHYHSDIFGSGPSVLHLYLPCTNSSQAFRIKIPSARNSSGQFKHLPIPQNSDVLILLTTFFKMEFFTCQMTLLLSSSSSTFTMIILMQNIMVVTRLMSCSNVSFFRTACTKTSPTTLQHAFTANSLKFLITNHTGKWDASTFQLAHGSLSW